MADQFKILVADDDANLADVISEVLSADHHLVVTVSDGVQALDAAFRENPDLVILDLNMPGTGTDGYEVIRRLRECDATQKIPIIVLTANNDEGAAAKGFAGGADDFLIKPFIPSHLRARVSTWLLRHSDRSQQD